MLNSFHHSVLFIVRLGINLSLLALLSYHVTYTLLRWQQPIPLSTAAQASQRALTRLPVDATTPAHLDVAPLVNARLFGQPPAPKVAVSTPARTLPTTKLNLTLRGIVYHEESNLSFAMIQAANQKTKRYRVGDAIQPQVKLHAIQPRNVVLLRHGQYETLLLKGDNTRKATGGKNTPSRRTSASTTDKTPQQLLKRYQSQLRSSPQSLLRLARIKPMKENGRFIGYRLRPNHDRAVFQTFGLRSGDILTGVNGIKLDSPLKGLSVVQQLATAKQLTLELRRNGQTLDLSFSLE